MIIYVERPISNIDGIEAKILTSNEVIFVFKDEEVLYSNEGLLTWIENSPLKEKFHTFVYQK